MQSFVMTANDLLFRFVRFRISLYLYSYCCNILNDLAFVGFMSVCARERGINQPLAYAFEWETT